MPEDIKLGLYKSLLLSGVEDRICCGKLSKIMIARSAKAPKESDKLDNWQESDELSKILGFWTFYYYHCLNRWTTFPFSANHKDDSVNTMFTPTRTSSSGGRPTKCKMKIPQTKRSCIKPNFEQINNSIMIHETTCLKERFLSKMWTYFKNQFDENNSTLLCICDSGQCWFMGRILWKGTKEMPVIKSSKFSIAILLSRLSLFQLSFDEKSRWKTFCRYLFLKEFHMNGVKNFLYNDSLKPVFCISLFLKWIALPRTKKNAS